MAEPKEAKDNNVTIGIPPEVLMQLVSGIFGGKSGPGMPGGDTGPGMGFAGGASGPGGGSFNPSTSMNAMETQATGRTAPGTTASNAAQSFLGTGDRGGPTTPRPTMLGGR